jgi:methionine sulfoxide reductase catalytic subunit
VSLIRIPKRWEITERLATPEPVYLNRRDILRKLGFSALGLAGIHAFLQHPGCCTRLPAATFADEFELAKFIPKSPTNGLYPAKRNLSYKLDRLPTNESVAARYNNFYEFNLKKDVWRSIERFQTRPWQIEVSGEIDKIRVFDIDDLIRKFPLEERLYRHRCVEAWSMVVPWTGFPLKSLISFVKPNTAARYVRMISFLKPEQAPEQKRASWYPWPYFEALTIQEATNELAFLVTGTYGHELTKQHGAPLRLALPWKYGYKSIKSIVRIEFTRKQPSTFWNSVQPNEYGFESNVNPEIPHPRWSQARETVIDTGEKPPTLKFNGYGEYVAGLYS